MAQQELQVGAVVVSATLAGLSSSFIGWRPIERDFYRHWVSRRVWRIQAVAIVGHAATGAGAAFGASVLGWFPFDSYWFWNGVAYAAAAEGVIRANVAGLQISSASKVWSLAELIAGGTAKQLSEAASLKIKGHLSTTFKGDDQGLAQFMLEQLQALHDLQPMEARQYDYIFGGVVPVRSTALRVATEVAVKIQWKSDE